jgi:hypothetical protein
MCVRQDKGDIEYLEKSLLWGCDWDDLSWVKTPHCAKFLDKHLDKVNWEYLSAHIDCKHSYAFADRHADRVDWSAVCRNLNEVSVKLVKKHTIKWDVVSNVYTESAYDLLSENIDHANWKIVSKCSTEWAELLLNNNPDNIDWGVVSCCSNSRQCDIVVANPDKVDWFLVTLFAERLSLEFIREHADRIDMDVFMENHLDRVISVGVTAIFG